MLRVIEKKMANNPNIIFMGAANNLSHLDPAAYRVGRYGEFWVLNANDEEDVRDHFRGNFERLGINHRPAEETNADEPSAQVSEGVDAAIVAEPKGLKTEEYSTLYKQFVQACEGLTPLTIAQSINNYVCVQRARTGQAIEELDTQLLQGLINHVEKRKARFKARDAELKRNRDAQRALRFMEPPAQPEPTEQ